MNDTDGEAEKKFDLADAWWKLRRFIIPIRIGKFGRKVRLQMLAMMGITLGLVLLSLYVFHFS